MNKATFEPYKNNVKFGSYNNNVELETIRIESDYYFLQPTYPADFPKERKP